MKKSILRTENLLPIAASFLLLPNFVFAQNAEQVKKIRESSNLKQLNVLQKGFGKSTLSVKELQTKAKSLKIPFEGESNGRYYQLRGFDKNGRPLYYISYNTGAAEGTGTNKLHPEAGVFNLEGSGMKVHEWDGGGVRTSHQEFGGRVAQKDVPLSSSEHATHVAGTMVASGVDVSAKGMAPKATLDAYDWNNDEDEMIAAATAGAILSNHSYGYIGGFAWGNWSNNQGWHWFGSDDDTEFKGYGKYATPDRDWDLIALNAPFYLPVKAAGNPRGDGPAAGETHYVRNSSGQWVSSNKVRQRNGGNNGFDCVLYGSTGKNLLVVGAAQKISGGYKSPADVRMASFSAFGPTDDGRIKPDISGVGVGLKSTVSDGDTAYGTMSGTSMASPNVTGSLLLLQEHYYKKFNAHMKSATLKALAIATANEAGEAPGPDYASGWGLLNVFDAAKAISLKDKYALIEEKSLQNGATEEIQVVASGTEPLKVTIAWTDPVPTTLPSFNTLNDRTKVLVNDLDVRVIKDGVEELPWRLNPDNPASPAIKADNDVDNVEQVVIDNPVPGATYTIKVSHKGTLKKNNVTTGANNTTVVTLVDTDSQDYGIVVTGINNGVTKDLTVTAVDVKVSPVEYSSATPVEFKVTNKGTEVATDAKVIYKLLNKDSNNQEVTQGEISVPSLNPGETTTVLQNIDLSKSFVNYTIVAEVIYAGDEIELNNKANAEVYGIIADLTPDLSSYEFGYEDDFAKSGWVSEDKDADGRTWRKYDDASLAYEGNSFALNFPGNKTNVNDWLFSNPLRLKKDVLYRVTFYARKFRTSAENISIFLGSTNSSTSMTSEIAPKVEALGAYNKYSYEFSVDSDQIAYMGFNHKTVGDAQSYAFAMDNVKFEYAENKPNVDFAASKLNPNSFETVSLTNNTITASTLPINSWEWSFSPNTVSFVESTSSASKEPKVVFNQEGVYAITLKATNAKGEGELTKETYVTVKNTATVADFTVNSQSIYSGEAVVFTNTSTGNPKPTEYKWIITPSDGVEYVGGTTDTSENPNVKFSKGGKYKVALTATSPYNSNTLEKDNYISVIGIHNDVENLTHSFDENTKNLTLKWDRPDMTPMYSEGFENAGNMPADMTIIDGNSDNKIWTASSFFKNNGEYGVRSYSWYVAGGAVDVDDYLVTPKLRKGAEVLKYAIKHPWAERYDIYIVEAPASGQAPTVEEIKAGHKIHTSEATEKIPAFVTKEFNIKQYADKDFFVVFHHRTVKADNAFYVALDDVEVGYDNSPAAKSGASTSAERTLLASSELDYKKVLLAGQKLVSDNMLREDANKTNNVSNSKITFGITTLPHLVGYEVVKDGTSVSNIDDYNTRLYNETMTKNGTYTYDVYALYSDGAKSNKQTVVVDITTLSTSDVNANGGLKVYANPSNGYFVVEAANTVSSLKAGVYDMSGKQILSNSYNGNKFELNLTQQPKGVYILNLVDDKGVKHNVKLMVK
ncbi:S8 family serine peptidase [Riemerella anatipestifer]|uniref:S8 family serine peptidase n=1 Tax=Riemerella anatipestifer TaxID=34085 RepID=UPI0030BFF900